MASIHWPGGDNGSETMRMAAFDYHSVILTENPWPCLYFTQDALFLLSFVFPLYILEYLKIEQCSHMFHSDQ